MSGAWQPDPWGRFGFRWVTELGWTEHVSDGMTLATDRPGPRAWAPMPAPDPAPIALQPASPVATRAQTKSAPAPVAGTEGRARRWGLIAAAVVLLFVLGAVVFRDGDGDREGEGGESSELVTVADTSTPEVASAGPVPPTLPAAPTTVAPTTVVETTVSPTTPETVPATAAPAAPPVGLEGPARNDLQIDDLEWLAIADLLTQEFAMEVPSREVATAIGLQACEAASTSATAEDWELALAPIILNSGLPIGQTAMLLGATTVMMCIDEFARLAPDQMPTF